MKRLLSSIEILLLVCMTFSVTYIVAQTPDFVTGIPSESRTTVFARSVVLSVLGNNLVSAAEETPQILWTCPVDKKGAICQEYTSPTCNDQCATACVPVAREDYAECKLGTCIDTTEGACTPNAPKAVCEKQGGKWEDAAATELAECRPGCCIAGSQTQYVNEHTCSVFAKQNGIPAEFRSVGNELECLALANPEEEGACVVEDTTTNEKTCRLTTKNDCQSGRGSFYGGLLCSNTQLATNCQRQTTTGCVDGKDGVYWFDSCGNRENIYDANKGKSWNEGKLLSVEESCTLSLGKSLLARQTTCGNCNYLTGSVCGSVRAQDDSPAVGDFVCRDLSCVDEWGKQRKQGESWCAFESQIGVQGTGNEQRSVDVPGSQYYRKSCVNGEVRTDPCAPNRNEVCMEYRDDKAQFSSAACRLNMWQTCINANTDADKLAKCEENPDCTLKTVDIDSQFKFDRCVPKYPPGFDLTTPEEGGDAQAVCSMGTQTCTYQTTKKLFGGKKIVNANCLTPAFTETMNNLCISLGDCGLKVNIAGELGDGGYTVSGAPELNKDSAYVRGLETLARVQYGQYVDFISGAKLAELFGLNELLVKNMDILGGIAGIAGIGIAYAASSGVLGATYLTTAGVAAQPGVFGTSWLSTPAVAPGLTAAGGVVVGALIGAAATAFIIKYTGIGAGMSASETAALIALGALAGGALGYGAATGTLFTLGASTAAGVGWIPVAGWIIAAVVLIIVLYAWFSGVGKTKTTQVTFTCLPWQAPRGGDNCDECGKKGLPCSKYACQSLGQTCSFVNEGTSEELCVNSAPDDVSAPVLKPNTDSLLAGYSYTSVTDAGYVLVGTGTEGCLPSSSIAQLGVSLNEPAQCKFALVPTTSFDEMELYFDSESPNIYRYNHSLFFPVPSLGALGSDPDSPLNELTKADFRLYVKCSDKSGNANVQAYALSFCISPEDDKTPPVLGHFTPASPTYVSKTATEKEIVFTTNEQAECKWDTQDMAYDLMANEAECRYELEEATLQGWQCRAMLPIAADEQTYYFRCNDQPWLLEVDAGKRNSNAQSTSYSIQRSLTDLQITRLSPNDTIITAGGLPVVVDLEADTSGGAESERTYCEFSFGGGPYSRFFHTGTIDETHTQEGLKLYTNGDYSIPIKCYDDAGNTATASYEFSVSVDTSGPLITRVYEQGGLNVITNEEAICAYDTESCSFAFDEGTLLTGSDIEHSTSLAEDLVHYVRCKDSYGNIGSCISVRKSVL